jgi:hypothetical protein
MTMKIESIASHIALFAFALSGATIVACILVGAAIN